MRPRYGLPAILLHLDRTAFAYVQNGPLMATDPLGWVGVGVVGSGEAFVGVGPAGAAAQASAGAGFFWGKCGLNLGGYHGGGAYAGGPGYGWADPNGGPKAERRAYMLLRRNHQRWKYLRILGLLVGVGIVVTAVWLRLEWEQSLMVLTGSMTMQPINGSQTYFAAQAAVILALAVSSQDVVPVGVRLGFV